MGNMTASRLMQFSLNINLNWITTNGLTYHALSNHTEASPHYREMRHAISVVIIINIALHLAIRLFNLFKVAE